MDKRSFLKNLLLCAVAPQIIISGTANRAKWKSLFIFGAESAPLVQPIELYNALPFYLAKIQMNRNPDWLAWQNFFEKTTWQPGMGICTRPVEGALIKF